MQIKVEAKTVGQRDITSGVMDVSTCSTLRQLISQVVQAEVSAFRDRQEERRFLRVLTAADIEQARHTGKFDMGDHPEPQRVDEQRAVDAALQAFEDELYYVFLDGTACEQLDEPVTVKPDSQLRFVRLVALAGG